MPAHTETKEVKLAKKKTIIIPNYYSFKWFRHFHKHFGHWSYLDDRESITSKRKMAYWEIRIDQKRNKNYAFLIMRLWLFLKISVANLLLLWLDKKVNYLYWIFLSLVWHDADNIFHNTWYAGTINYFLSWCLTIPL